MKRCADYYVPTVGKRNDIVESRDEYTSENVFWIPVEARWGYLQDRAKQPDVGVLIDRAYTRDRSWSSAPTKSWLTGRWQSLGRPSEISGGNGRVQISPASSPRSSRSAL